MKLTKPGRVYAMTALACVIALIAIWAAVAGVVHYERQSVVQEAHRNAANVARILAADVEGTLGRLDRILIHLRNEYRRTERDFASTAAPVLDILAGEPVFQIAVINRDGELAYSTINPDTVPIGLNDRNYFRVHRDSTDDRLFISRVVVGRLSDQRSIQITRKMMAPDGTFDGVIVLSIDPAHFADFYSAIDTGREGAVALLGQDRFVRAWASRIPAKAPIFSEPFAPDRPYFDPKAPDQGIVTAIGHLDGISRTGAYHRLAGYPLIVVVMLSEREVLAPFMKRRAHLLTGATAASVLIIMLAGLAALVTHRNVTMVQKIAENEERWRLAFNAVGDGVWDWNVETDEVWFSPGSKSKLGFAEDEIGDHADEWRKRIHPDDLENTLRDLDAHLAGKSPVYSNEHRLATKGGGYQWILDRGVVVSRTPDGSPRRMVGTHTDITASKAMEQELRALTSSLEQRVESRTTELREKEAALAQAQKMEAIGQAIGTITHDFNNVLQGIHLGLAVLRTKLPDNDPARGLFAHVEQAVERGKILVGELLAYSRRQDLHATRLDLNQVVRDISKAIAVSLRPDITLELSLTGDACPVLGDASHLERALMNLATNARDAMPDGGQLSIRTEVLDLGAPLKGMERFTPGRYAMLRVCDTGTGIPPDLLQRVCEPFFTTKPLGRGTGLGLSMVYGLVRQSGGQIVIDSTVARGTTISIYLPIHAATDAENAAASTAA